MAVYDLEEQLEVAHGLTVAATAARCIAVKRFLPLGFPVQTNTDR
jgi:hypothetical protein